MPRTMVVDEEEGGSSGPFAQEDHRVMEDTVRMLSIHRGRVPVVTARVGLTLTLTTVFIFDVPLQLTDSHRFVTFDESCVKHRFVLKCRPRSRYQKRRRSRAPIPTRNRFNLHAPARLAAGDLYFPPMATHTRVNDSSALPFGR